LIYPVDEDHGSQVQNPRLTATGRMAGRS